MLSRLFLLLLSSSSPLLSSSLYPPLLLAILLLSTSSFYTALFLRSLSTAPPLLFLSIASIHGANMATDAPDSPHRMAPKIQCECYFACAEIDKWAPPADIQQLEASLTAAKVKHRIEWYPQAEHGFVFPKREGIYKATAAERHWERLFSLFGRTLQTKN